MPINTMADLDALVARVKRAQQVYATYRVVLPAQARPPYEPALVLETRMAPQSKMTESVPANELGPLG